MAGEPVFVTGGTGYIGRTLTGALLARGHAVHVLGWIPAARENAERLGLVTLNAMKAALVRAIEAPPGSGVRIVEVPEIRRTQLR